MPCEVAVEMQTMVRCKYAAAASLGWAEHYLKQKRSIKDDDNCVS